MNGSDDAISANGTDSTDLSWVVDWNILKPLAAPHGRWRQDQQLDAFWFDMHVGGGEVTSVGLRVVLYKWRARDCSSFCPRLAWGRSIFDTYWIWRWWSELWWLNDHHDRDDVHVFLLACAVVFSKCFQRCFKHMLPCLVSKASLKSGPDGRDKHVHTLPVHGAQTRGLSRKLQLWGFLCCLSVFSTYRFAKNSKVLVPSKS